MTCNVTQPFQNIQCKQIADAPLEFGGILLLNTLMIAMAFFLLNYIWVKPIGI